jgi:cell division protein FtsB
VKENNVLREENSQLRRELLKLRKEPVFENSRSMEKISLSPDVSDLRGTIKKEMGELRDLKAKVDALTAQCRLYE